MTRQNNTVKNSPFLLSNQVKAILQNRGFSSLFNFSDYELFKRNCKDAFNKPLAIVEQFLAEAEPEQNDFNQYIF